MGGAAHAQFTLTIPATGATTVTRNLATLNSPLNPLGAGYYCDTYTVTLTQGIDYMFNMSGNNGSATIPQPTGNARLFLLDLNNNQVNLTTGGDPNLYFYGPGSGNDGTPGWGGAVNPSGGANLVYTAASTGTYTLVCTTPTQNTQFQYPLMVMQMITFNNPQYTAISFPYTNSNVTLCSFNNYMFGEGGELFLDIYSVQLPPGLFTFTATMRQDLPGYRIS